MPERKEKLCIPADTIEWLLSLGMEKTPEPYRYLVTGSKLYGTYPDIEPECFRMAYSAEYLSNISTDVLRTNYSAHVLELTGKVLYL